MFTPSSIKLESQIRSLPEDDSKPVQFADAVVTLVWIDKATGEAVALPRTICELAE